MMVEGPLSPRQGTQKQELSEGLIYDNTSTIIAGTRESLISKAIEFVNSGSNLAFARTVCLTHGYFSDSVEFLDIVVKEKGFKLLQLWLEEYYFQFSENLVLKRKLDSYLDKWIDTKQTDLVLSIKNSNGKGHLNRALARLSGIQRTVSSKTLPKQSAHAPEAVTSILDIPAIEAAKQICIIEHQLFEGISLSEFILRSRDKTAQVPKLSALIRNTNKMIYGIATDIVKNTTLKMRAIALNHWIEVALNLRKLNNFNGLMEVIGALNLNSIGRLKKTWKALPEKSVQTFDSLAAEMDVRGGYKVYRKILSEVNGPAIPFVGVYLSQLTFIEENPDKLANGLLNFQKMELVSKVISEIQKFQKESPNFVAVPSIQEYLTVKMSGLSEDELYDKSRVCEPPEISDDSRMKKQRPSKHTRVVNRKNSISGEVVYIMPSIIREKQGRIQAFRGVATSSTFAKIQIHLLTPRPGETRVEIVSSHRAKPRAISVLSPRQSVLIHPSTVRESFLLQDSQKKKKRKVPVIITSSSEETVLSTSDSIVSESPDSSLIEARAPKRKKKKRTKVKPKLDSGEDDGLQNKETRKKHRNKEATRKKHHKRKPRSTEVSQEGDAKSAESPLASVIVNLNGVGLETDWEEPAIPGTSPVSSSRIAMKSNSREGSYCRAGDSSIVQSASNNSVPLGNNSLLDVPSSLGTAPQTTPTNQDEKDDSGSFATTEQTTDPKSLGSADEAKESPELHIISLQHEDNSISDGITQLLEEFEPSPAIRNSMLRKDIFEEYDESSYFSETEEGESSEEIVSEEECNESDDSYDESDQSDTDADFFDPEEVSPRKITPRYRSIDDLYELYKASLTSDIDSVIHPAAVFALSSPSHSFEDVRIAYANESIISGPNIEAASPRVITPQNEPVIVEGSLNPMEFNRPSRRGKGSTIYSTTSNQVIVLQEVSLEQVSVGQEDSKSTSDSIQEKEQIDVEKAKIEADSATRCVDNFADIETTPVERNEAVAEEKLKENNADNGVKGGDLLADSDEKAVESDIAVQVEGSNSQENKATEGSSDEKIQNATKETGETTEELLDKKEENSDQKAVNNIEALPKKEESTQKIDGAVQVSIVSKEDVNAKRKEEVPVREEKQHNIEQDKKDDRSQSSQNSNKDDIQEDFRQDVKQIREIESIPVLLPTVGLKEVGREDKEEAKEKAKRKAKDKASQKAQERARQKAKQKEEVSFRNESQEGKKKDKDSKDKKKEKSKGPMRRSKSTDLRQYSDEIPAFIHASSSASNLSKKQDSIDQTIIPQEEDRPSEESSTNPTSISSGSGSLRKKKFTERVESWLLKGSFEPKPAAVTEAKRLKHSNSFTVTRKSSAIFSDKEERDAEFAHHFTSLKRKSSSRIVPNQTSPTPSTSSSLPSPSTVLSSSPPSWLDRFLRKEK